jgi:ribosomal protein S18 acetylase RimI-like enzyme
MLNISRAVKSDSRTIVEFLKEVWTNTFESKFDHDTVEKVLKTCFAHDAILRQIEDKTWVFLIAKENDGRITGMINARQDEHFSIIVNRLYIRSDSQGKGTGSMLLEAIIQYFPDAGKFILEVIDNNTKAIGFYEQKGFKKTGINKMQAEDVVLNVFVMEKIIKH